MYMYKEEVVEIVCDMGGFENQGWDTVLHVYVGLVQAPLITHISMQDSSNKRANHVWEKVTDPVCDNEWILHSHSRFTSTEALVSFEEQSIYPATDLGQLNTCPP